jgi:glycosyltransferase involved in cell wall biosynthesis
MNGPRVTVVAPSGPTGASTRERVERWLERLQLPATRRYYLGAGNARPQTLLRHPLAALAAEHRVRSGSATPRDGVLLLHREATPLSRGRLEARLLSRAARGIYDIDDALHCDHQGTRLRRWFRTPDKYRGIAAAADIVMAGSALMADWASQYCSSVLVMPTCVDPDEYQQKTAYSLADPPVIGWIGTLSGVRYLEAVADQLLAVHAATGATLEIVSSLLEPPPVLAPMTRVVPWSLPVARRQLATWDVGIMPLPDEPFQYGKSAYKLLQYCAVGLPSVATPYGANVDIIRRAGACGPERDSDWGDALLSLLAISDEGRRELGRRARAVAADYTFDRWQAVWERTVLG